MTERQKGLRAGDVIRCERCGELHHVKPSNATTTAAKDFLYVFCIVPEPGRYHIGSVGGQSNRGPIIKKAT